MKFFRYNCGGKATQRRVPKSRVTFARLFFRRVGRCFGSTLLGSCGPKYDSCMSRGVSFATNVTIAELEVGGGLSGYHKLTGLCQIAHKANPCSPYGTLPQLDIQWHGSEPSYSVSPKAGKLIKIGLDLSWSQKIHRDAMHPTPS